MKPQKDIDGYQIVTLYNGAKYKKTVKVHKIVAKTFLNEFENNLQVNHINGDKNDNRVCNLEYCTCSENNKHAWAIGLKKASEKYREQMKRLGKQSAKAVEQYDLQGNFINAWQSATEASRQLNINQSNISACCIGKRKTAGKYIWKYKEEIK